MLPFPLFSTFLFLRLLSSFVVIMYCFTQAYPIHLLHCVNILFNINYVIIHYDLGIMLICPKWKKINVTLITDWIFFPCCVSIHPSPPSSVLNMSLCLCHYHLRSVTRFFLGGGQVGRRLSSVPCRPALCHCLGLNLRGKGFGTEKRKLIIKLWYTKLTCAVAVIRL